MTPLAGRSTATLLALGGLAALYSDAYKTAAGCTLLASYVALSSLKELPKERRARRLARSASAPELFYQKKGSLRSIELLPSTDLPLPLRDSSPRRRSRFEKWGVDLERGHRTVFNSGWLHLPTTRAEEKSRFPRIDLTTLPQRSTTLSEKITPLFSRVKLRRRNEIVDGIVDITDICSPLWQKVFPNQNPSLEVGNVEGAAGRTAMRGGSWIVITNDWNVAQEIRRGRGDRGWTAPLIMRGRGWNYTHFYMDILFKRIDVRCLKRSLVCEQFILLFSSALDVDGELRIIFKREDQLNIDKCKQLFNELSFAPPEELPVDEEIVEARVLGPKVTLSQQLHLIYRGVR